MNRARYGKKLVQKRITLPRGVWNELKKKAEASGVAIGLLIENLVANPPTK